jgi:hypothetical protein
VETHLSFGVPGIEYVPRLDGHLQVMLAPGLVVIG